MPRKEEWSRLLAAGGETLIDEGDDFAVLVPVRRTHDDESERAGAAGLLVGSSMRARLHAKLADSADRTGRIGLEFSSRHRGHTGGAGQWSGMFHGHCAVVPGYGSRLRPYRLYLAILA